MFDKSFFGYSRRVISLALPMAWSRFIQMAGWFLGSLMIAQLGSDVLAASALITTVQTTIILLFMSILFALAVISGRLYGEGKLFEIGNLFQHSLFLSLVLAAFMALAFYFVDKLLLLTGQSPELLFIVKTYFHTYTWVALPLIVLVAMQQLCYGILKQRLVIYNNLLSLAFFIPLTYALVFGRWGFPALGIKGLPYATFWQCVVNIITLGISLLKNKEVQQYALFKRHRYQGLHYIKQLFQVGWPMSVQFGGELIALSVLTIFTGWISVAALSALQITQQMIFLLLVPLFAVAESAGVLVSQLIGAKQFHEVRSMGNVCVFLGSCLIIVLSMSFIIFPKIITGMYINIHNPDNARVVELARWLFYLSIPMLFLETLRNLYSGALRGFYDTRVPMWVGLFSIWIIAIPLAYVLAFWVNWGVVGIRVGTIIGFLFGAAVLWRRWCLKTGNA